MGQHGWYGIDLDGTLAYYDGWKDWKHIGEPIPKMVEFVKYLLSQDYAVKIFTARVHDEVNKAEIITLIQDWCEAAGLPRLPVTNVKDFGMIRLYDDRCVQVKINTGEFVE